jgi:hypothetical protein
LALAIEAHSQAVERQERVLAALQRLADQIFDQLRPAASRAEKALAVARQQAPRLLVDALLGDEPVRSTVADAELELGVAERKLADAKEAKSVLSDEAERARIAVNAAQRDLDEAVRSAVAADPRRAAVLAEYNRAARRALRCAMILRTSGMIMRGHEAHGLRFVINDAARAIDKMGTAFVPDPEWVAAVSALHSDADALLPDLPPPDDPVDAVCGAPAEAA